MEQIFDGFQLTDAVRTNGICPLYRAVRTSDDTMVALKVFSPDAAPRAARECDIAASVDHPHVLRGELISGHDGQVGLVSPWMEGGSLAGLIAVRRRIRWPEALTVLIPLADAMSAAHEGGWVHGDISAGNILFDGRGRPMLADFGAARAALEGGGSVLVTPQHVAPEIVRGANPGPATDLFSLGSIALMCLAGHGAWPAEDLDDVLVQSAAGQWPDLEENMAPPSLRALVRRLLAPEPAARGSAAQLAVELRRVGSPEPVALVAGAAGSIDDVPGAATVVRPDAVRPPASHAQERGRRHRSPVVRAAAGRLSWRGFSAAAAVVVLLAGALAVGDWWGEPPPTASAHSPLDRPTTAASAVALTPSAGIAETPGPATDGASAGQDVDWVRVVSQLDAARSAAFRARDVTLLDAVYAPGSPLRRADEGRIAELREASLRPDGADHRVTSVRLLGARADGSVTVVVVESQPAAALLDASGAVTGYSIERHEARLLMHLAVDQPAGPISAKSAGHRDAPQYRIQHIERG